MITKLEKNNNNNNNNNGNYLKQHKNEKKIKTLGFHSTCKNFHTNLIGEFKKVQLIVTGKAKD